MTKFEGNGLLNSKPFEDSNCSSLKSFKKIDNSMKDRLCTTNMILDDIGATPKSEKHRSDEEKSINKVDFTQKTEEITK